MPKSTISLGTQGEELAVVHLKKQGFKILAQNYRQKTGEIDIIARDGTYLVFIEVKTRKSLRFGRPYEAVTHKKQTQITKVALEYITRNKLHDQPMRFDVISITIHAHHGIDIKHLKNCFEATF